MADYKQIRVRRDTLANWQAANPTLADGELAWVSDTRDSVAGDGASDFDTLWTAAQSIPNRAEASADAATSAANAAQASAASATSAAAVTASFQTNRLADVQTSTAQAAIDYAASSWSERWADLTAWPASSGVQVSGGSLYGTTSTPKAAARTFVVQAGQSARIRGRISRALAPNGLTLIGVSNAAAGAAPSGSNLLGIGFISSGSPGVWDRGTEVDQNLAPTYAGDHFVTITIDATTISLVMNSADGTREYRYQVPRATFGAVNNINVYVADNRGTSGNYVGSVGAKLSPATITDANGIEQVGYSTAWLPDANGQNMRITAPVGYDSRKPSPLVLYCHGSGESETAGSTGSYLRAVQNTLTAAGFIFAASAQHGSNWGNDAALADVVNLYKYVRGRFPLNGQVVIMGASMGAMSAMLTVAGRAIPLSAGVFMMPAMNLRAMYDAGTYKGTISTAYGIASDGSDYAAKTAGHDPALMPGSAFRGLPVRFYASPGDTVVAKTLNADVLAAKIAPYAAEATVITTTGDHGDGSNYQPDDVLTFLNRVLNR